MLGMKLYIIQKLRMNKLLPYKALTLKLRDLSMLVLLVSYLFVGGALSLKAQALSGLGSADDLGRTLFKSMQDPDFGWLRYTLGSPEVYRIASPEDTKGLEDDQVLASIREKVYPRMLERSQQLLGMLEIQDISLEKCTYLRTETTEIQSVQDVIRKIQVFLSFQEQTIRLEALGFEHLERWYLTEIILPEKPSQLIDP